MTAASIVRRPTYFEDAAHPFFGWYHAAPDAPQHDVAAVICGPLGSEYTRSHRSVRHLADRLARAGIPAVRFDWHGTGNSPGTDLDPGRVDAWLANIRAACDHARRLSGRTRVALIGIRLGGTLAALASRDIDPALLVLWNSPSKGKPYVRELQAIAATAARAASETEGALEAAGAVMTAETLERVRALDLTRDTPHAGRVLLVARDDLSPDTSLDAPLAAAGIAFDRIAVPGWNGMMADHQFTVVPDDALAQIVDWVNHQTENRCQTPISVAATNAARTVAASVSDTIEERLCHFGADRHLFGVLSRTSEDTSRPAILMFNGGAVHHVGPNRIYVTLARRLAEMGFASLRFDLEGIGDSVLRKPGRENHPYPDHATHDAHAAMDYLRREFGYTRFIAIGLCSGAHTAFHTCLDINADAIEEVVMINPYAFYWQEGMSLDVISRMADAQQYKKSMRDPSRWLKLLKGDVNFRRLIEVALSHPKTLAKSYYDALLETVAPQKAPRLSRDLRRLFEQNRTVTVLVSEGDPGGDIIMSEAKLTAKRALARGQMRLETIAGGDHTFTQSRPRRQLVERVAAHLQPRLQQPTQESARA